MVMTDLTFDEQIKCPRFGSERLVGWFPEFDRQTQQCWEINTKRREKN